MELRSIVGKPLGIDKSDSPWGQAKCSALTPITELWASFTAHSLIFSLFLNCYRFEQSIKAVANPYKSDGKIVVLLSIREQGVAFTALFLKCIFISMKIKEESLYRDCLWNTFSHWQCVNVTWWVPSPKSVISLGGVFVAQGSLDFSVTAASLATTPSLPVKVRLLIACTASHRALKRHTASLSRTAAKAIFTAANGQLPLVLCREILLYFNSLISGLFFPHGQTVWCTLSQHSSLTNNQSISELFSCGGPQQQGTPDYWGSNSRIVKHWSAFAENLWYLVWYQSLVPCKKCVLQICKSEALILRFMVVSHSF